jgi:hypothetical protein
MNKLPLWARYTLCVLVFAFAMMGATNAQHTSAKIVYGVLNALVGAAAALTALRARQSD